ncbi:CocE/NonD family hydrolase [Gordonia sp. OPL2]|uniref:CocE/NonD family hydrolase n=1 Tax=Gordonia sp. OPL2 TaxID=2486274 RepID=UPI0016564773|nr:CocE/NonD family hydrolase [Gordonia sp. OPL2]
MSQVSGIERGQRRLNGIQTTGRDFRNLSEPVHAMTETHDVAVPMRDGIDLRADLYRPTTAPPVPALISFSAYPRQIQNTRAPLGLVEAGASDFFVPRGYVHVIANARGTAGSDGTWTFFDHQEREDLYDLIEWVAAQPWCDGNVGMLGISYFAMVQLSAAAERPPSLKAIFPFGVNESVYDALSHHGLFVSSFVGPWFSAIGVLSQRTDRLWRSTALKLLTKVLSDRRVHRRLDHVNGEAAAAALTPILKAHYPDEPFGRLWRESAVEHPTHDDFWADRNVSASLADVQIPVYLGCDWDNVIMHLPGTFTTWEALAHNPNVRMSLLPEGGLNWPWETLHVEALAWYDHWLKGADTGIMEGDPIRYALPGSDEWHTARVWPPAESHIVEYALRADGTLDIDEGESGTRSYFHVPDDFHTPRAAEPHADRLVWEGPTVESSLDLAGDFELRLDAAITGVDTAWIAVLYDVAPGTPDSDDRGSDTPDDDSDDSNSRPTDVHTGHTGNDSMATPITGGWLRASLRAVDEERSRPGRPVLPCTTPQAIPVGEQITYRIPVVANARRLSPGHRLRLVLTSSDHADDAPTILGFRHADVGEASRNTIASSSRLLVPVLSH